MFFFSGFICMPSTADGAAICGCERGESQSGFEGDLFHLPWNCPGEHPQGDGVQAMTKLCSHWANLPAGHYVDDVQHC